LAAANPDRHRRNLVTLTDLGSLFAELGRPAGMLPVAQESAAIRRELAATYSDRRPPDQVPARFAG